MGFYSIRSFASTGRPLAQTRLTVSKHPWESLPTLWNIVDGLAALDLQQAIEVYHQVQTPASDCSSIRRIEY